MIVIRTISIAAAEHAVDATAVNDHVRVGRNAIGAGAAHVGSIATAVDVIDGVFLAAPHMHRSTSAVFSVQRRQIGRPVAAAVDGTEGIGRWVIIGSKR